MDRKSGPRQKRIQYSMVIGSTYYVMEIFFFTSRIYVRIVRVGRDALNNGPPPLMIRKLLIYSVRFSIIKLLVKGILIFDSKFYKVIIDTFRSGNCILFVWHYYPDADESVINRGILDIKYFITNLIAFLY